MKDDMYDGIGEKYVDLGLDAVIEYTQSPYDNWVMDKNIKVSKNNKKITKKYSNKTNGSTITVIEMSGIIFLKDYQEGKRENGVQTKRTLKELQDNPITVPLLPIVINLCNQDPEDTDCDNEDNCDFSGRIIYTLDDCYQNFNIDTCDKDGSLDFYCGPETKSGAVDDRGEDIIDDKLKKLFADFDISIQASEHFHMIELGDLKAKDVWNIVEKRLIRSGAVKMKEWK